MIQIRRGIFFMKKSINPASIVKLGRDSVYTFGKISCDQISRDPLFAARGKVERFTERLKAGHHCFGFLDSNGAVVYYMWVTQARERPVAAPFYLGVLMVVPSGSSYIWDCFTAPEHRRRGLYSNGLLEATMHSTEAGAWHVLICCAKENTASISVILSAGFSQLFEYSVTGFAGVRLIQKGPRVWGATFVGRTYDILRNEV